MFAYIASNDEYGARAVCNKYGYEASNANTPESLGECLVQLTETVGDPAWQDILALHPDKEVLSEYNGGTAKLSTKPSGCGCKEKKSDPSVNIPGGGSIKESHLFIFAGALLIAAAIIAKN